MTGGVFRVLLTVGFGFFIDGTGCGCRAARRPHYGAHLPLDSLDDSIGTGLIHIDYADENTSIGSAAALT